MTYSTSRTVRAHLRWGRVGRDDRQDGVDGGRGNVGVGDVESPPRDLHEVPPTVDELALVGEPSPNESWLWFVEVVLVAGEVGVESGAAIVGDGEGHGLMPRTGPHHHGIDVFGGGVRGWVVEVVVELTKMVALPLVGSFKESAKRADSDADPGAGNVSGRGAPGAAILVAGFRWVAEPIVN